MGTTPMGMQQPANRVPTITTKKPLTLSSLGAGNVGFGGAKAVSLSAAKHTSTAPVSTPASNAAVKETVAEDPIPKNTPETTPTPVEESTTPVEEPISVDAAEGVEEAPTSSVSLLAHYHI